MNHVAVAAALRRLAEALEDNDGEDRRESAELVAGALTYTVTEAAKRLGVSRTVAYKLVKDGAIPTLSIPGSERRVAEVDLVAFVDRLRQPRLRGVTRAG